VSLGVSVDRVIVGPAPYPGFRGCFVTSLSTKGDTSYIMLTVNEAGAFPGPTSIIEITSVQSY
jgi:hypothetical protein